MGTPPRPRKTVSPAKAPKKALGEASEDTYPMRLNKYLAHKGHATRRAADTLIEKGQVFVNGIKATLGDKVNESDTVEVRHSKKAPSYSYFAYNKPRGLVTLASEPGEDDVMSTLPPELKMLRLFPVGRLDKASHGLLVLTNDGRITDRLLNPKYDHVKKYEVTTREPLRPSFKSHMEKGVDIEGYLTKPAKVWVKGDHRFLIELTEGKTHQIRRMVVAMHNEVSDLRRVSVMNVQLGNLPSGDYRRIEGEELDTFLESLGLFT